MKSKVFQSIRSTLWTTFMFLAGSTLLAFLVAAFVSPHGIIMAGTTGIGLALCKFLPVDTAIVVLALNILMLLLGLFALGKKFFLATIASSLLYPVLLAVMQRIPGIESLTEDPLLAAILGGGLLGLALGMVMRVGASTGGTDVLNLVMNKYFYWPVSVCVWITDIIIIIVQALFSNTEQILYGIIMLVIESIVLDRVMVMGQSQIQVLVMSSKYDEIRRRLLDELEAGVTMLHIESGYTNREGKGILCVIPPRKQFAAKEIIYAVDPEAFLTITQVWEVQGRGFSFERRMGAKQAR
jgi:uncharacterized membrane-anchored protein YitT (DUF2179 family)